MKGRAGASLEHRVFKAGVAVGAAHLLFKLAGLIQAKAMAYYLPRDVFEAVYVFAFESCIFSVFLIGQEVIGPTLLPVFMREKEERGEDAAWNFAGALLALQGLLLIMAVALLMLFPRFFVRLLTAWSPDKAESAGLFTLGAAGVRALAPALIGLSFGSTTYMLLNAYKRFFLAAFGDAVWKFAVVAALVVAALCRQEAAPALVAGLVAGSVLKLLTHLAGLRDRLDRLRFRLDLRNPALHAMLRLTLPLLAGIVFAKFRDVVNNVYILSRLEAGGLMQANSMGRKLHGTLHWLVPYTLSIAFFPFFCEMVDRDDRRRLGAVVTRAGRQMLALFIPLAAVVAVLAVPLTGLLFGGGHFDAPAVRRTALTTACYTCALPAAAIEALLMQAFFASRRMVSVTAAGIVFSGFSVMTSWLGLRCGGGNPWIVLTAIAGGFALSRILKSITLTLLLGRSVPVFPWRSTLGFIVRVLLSSAAAALAAGHGARLAAAPPAAGLPDALPANEAISLLAGGTAAAVALLISYRLLKVTEPFDMLRWLRSRRRAA
jgi:putative peptidoglycan lipid II flippase